MLLRLLSLLLTGLDCFLGAPAGREVYRMPQSALKALSDRGTVVLEAAMASALSTLERASSERSLAEAGCRGCVPCLFQNCGQLSGSCLSPSSASSEPGCDVISKAQKLQGEEERSWALSQVCAYYQYRCPPAEVNTESCIRIMGESCSARVLQCSLLNTMQNLEPAMQTQAQAVCGRKLSSVQNITQPRSRIVGGSPAPLGSWPWLVNLQLDGALMCGGVLVDSSWVVTAAHCFAGSRSESSWTAVVGEFDITKTDPDEQVLKVNRIISHPKFNPKTFNNDLALVELTSPVILSEHVTPVCLPSVTDPPTGTPCLVAGWGSLYEDGPSADVVMEAKVPLLPQNTCKSALGKELVTSTMFCAGYLSGGIDSCQGDSGGPLIYQDHISGRFQLYGITSWGDGCGEKGKPGVYTRVTAFSDWIQAEIQKSVGSREPTCPDLLKTTDMTEEEQRSEFGSLCGFYTLTCPQSQSVSSCSQMAEEKCLNRFKKCQLRSFLQSLLDLLQKAEDYIRDRVDLTFFTQTLPQLVEHIYNTAFTHSREKRDISLIPSLTLMKEHVGAAKSAELDLPALFRSVGSSLDDWENYLRDIAADVDDQPPEDSTDRQEDNLFSQSQDSLVQRLTVQYPTIISSLLSKLGSKAPPPMLRLDFIHLLEDPPSYPSVLTFPTSTPTLSDPNAKAQEPWSLLSAWISETQKLRTWDESEAVLNVEKEETTSEDFTFAQSMENFNKIELKSLMQTVPAVQQGIGDAHTDASQSRHAVKPLNLHRKYRSLLQKRQTAVASGKTSAEQNLPLSCGQNRLHKATLPLFPLAVAESSEQGAYDPPTSQISSFSNGVLSSAPDSQQFEKTNTQKFCPGLRESSQQIVQTRDSYSWVLNIPSKNLHMNFQEVLVDLNSKNDRGLYQARIKAVVGGRPLTFHSLVGLENESFYRSLPRILALALEALKS